MPDTVLTPEDRVARGLAEIARLRKFTGTPSEFWSAFLVAGAALAGAGRAALILKDTQAGSWKKLGDWAEGNAADRTAVAFNRALVEIGEKCVAPGSVAHVVESGAAGETRNYALAARLALSRPDDICVAAFLVCGVTEAQAQEILLRLKLVSDTPASYLAANAAGQSRGEAEKFAASLDAMVLLNSETKFLAAALALVNAAATRYACDRVSLGWLEGGYIRLKAISRTERFDKNMAAVKALELTMEEALDQDEEIVVPRVEGATYVSRDHEKFSKEQSAGNMASAPLRLDGKVVAVLTFERQSRPFNLLELQQFRLTCDQASRRLHDLKRTTDGWVGRRLANRAREKLSTVLGPEKTWLKVGVVAASLLLAALFLVSFDYRVEGKFILRSDNVAFVTSPFDGYIKEVLVKPGDSVKPGDPLMRLNTEELELELVAAVADRLRYLGEADKAQAGNSLAEMRIAKSLAEQAKAKIDLLEYRIGRATARAPFEGVLVEGDLRERLGAPIKQGDALFKISRMDSLFIEGEILQRDVHEIKGKAAGEISFVTQPKLKYPVKVERIYPAAFPKEGENIFTIRCDLAGKPDDWWRPGMSGLVKVEAGRRTLFWILTHRTVDFLRLWLWW